MKTYLVRFGHDNTGEPGKMEIRAESDHDAMYEMKLFVESGWRDRTWASTTRRDGREVFYRNVRGIATEESLIV